MFFQLQDWVSLEGHLLLLLLFWQHLALHFWMTGKLFHTCYLSVSICIFMHACNAFLVMVWVRRQWINLVKVLLVRVCMVGLQQTNLCCLMSPWTYYLVKYCNLPNPFGSEWAKSVGIIRFLIWKNFKSKCNKHILDPKFPIPCLLCENNK